MTCDKEESFLVRIELTLEPLHIESHGGNNNGGPLVCILEVIHNGGFSTVIQTNDQYVNLLLFHLQHGRQFIEETHL